MNQAENLLNSLSGDEVVMYSANPETEPHIVIGADRKITVPAELKRIAIQYDHNVETVTFDCPRYWDEHDLSKMVLYINYILADGEIGIYIAENITVENDIMHFTWTISDNITQQVGSIKFLICAKKVGEVTDHYQEVYATDISSLTDIVDTGETFVYTDADTMEDGTAPVYRGTRDGEYVYFYYDPSRDSATYELTRYTNTVVTNTWHSDLCVDMYVSEGIECTTYDVESDYPDLITQLLARMDELEENGGGGGSTPTPDVNIEIDQTYDPTSENAQSGIAVAEAVEAKMDKGSHIIIDYTDSIMENSIASTASNNIYNDAPGDNLAIISCTPGDRYRLDYSAVVSCSTVDCFIKNAAGKNILTVYDGASQSSKDEAITDFIIPTDGVSIVIHYRWNSPVIPTLYVLKDVITVFSEQLNAVQDELTNVKNDIASMTDKSPTVITRNAKAISQINAASCYGYHAKGSFNVAKRFTVLATTDVHFASKQLRNAVEFINGVAAIDCGICLGDIQGSNYHDNDGTWYTDIVNTSTKPFYTVLGNHDLTFNNASGLAPCGTPSEAFARFIQPTLDVVGENITLPYYAITNDTYKTVLICLNNYDAPTTLNSGGTDFAVKRYTEALSQGQIDWFISALSNIPNDYHLIIARHSYPIANELVGNDWSQTVRNKVDAVDGDKISAVLIGSDTAYNEDVVSDIVNAWKNKNNFSKTYAPKSTYSVCPTLNVAANFSSRTESNFVCYLVGHAHYDAICKSSLYNDQLIIGLCATADGEWQNEASDLPRVKNTKSEDAITTISVDTINRKIYLVRVGSDITFDMKKREHTVIDY